jgi:hypothetical protein
MSVSALNSSVLKKMGHAIRVAVIAQSQLKALIFIFKMKYIV